VRFVLGSVVGATLEWYPFAERGAHVVATAGYAELDTEIDVMHRISRGVGGAAALAYDWDAGAVTKGSSTGLRLGVELRVTVLRTFTAGDRHAAVSPALLMTFGFD
jgi:hypothetical protein